MMGEEQNCLSDDDVGIQWRPFKSQNIVHDLRRREISHDIRGTYFNRARRFYQQLVPNLSVLNVEKPPCYLRKFSPDGKFFIAISYDQTSIEIFDFLGSDAAGDLTNTVKGNVIPNEGGVINEQYPQIRMKIFSQFLQRRHVVRVTVGDEVLNRECSLFTDDGRYVIVGSCHQLNEEIASRYYEIYRNNESITPNSKLVLEDYSVFVIDLKTGVVCDRKQFKMDKIYLSHNQGLCLYGSVLAILSVQQQTIHVFKVSPQGTLIQVRTIGRFCYDDDEFFYSQTSHLPPRQLNRPYIDKVNIASLNI
ncbi:DET1 homolog [Elysia marginata]|uniref:DET1 homolog n=1 Tax=Elysia marginata TaxID=1093978 RepID=A0AAV4HJ40_9GAST|nr:DET1 homolog [Elysia marginata]